MFFDNQPQALNALNRPVAAERAQSSALFRQNAHAPDAAHHANSQQSSMVCQTIYQNFPLAWFSHQLNIQSYH